MREERLRLRCGSNYLLRRMRRHDVGPEELRGLRHRVLVRHGVLAGQMRVGMRGDADRLRGLLRRYVWKLTQLR